MLFYLQVWPDVFIILSILLIAGENGHYVNLAPGWKCIFSVTLILRGGPGEHDLRDDKLSRCQSWSNIQHTHVDMESSWTIV